MTEARKILRGAGAALLVTAGLAAPAAAQSLEQQVADLRAQVNDIVGDGSKGFRISPSTRLKVYGYVKGDFINDLDFDLGTTLGGINNVKAGTPEDSRFRAQAIESRLGFWAYTDTAMGELQTRIEGDFFGNGGGTFRLRHAYGELGPFLVGQTWTNFMPIETLPETLDFNGAAGKPFARLTQARYTQTFGGGVKAIFALEEDPAAGANNAPALVAAASYSFGESYVKVAGVYRSIEGTNTDIDGWGVNLSGSTSLWKGGKLMGSVTTGEGIASYMQFGGQDTIGEKAVKTSGISLGVSQQVTDQIKLGLVYGLRDVDFGAPTDTERLETVHASVFYKPVEKVMVGLEFIYASREQFDGQSVDARRVQASAKFSF